MTAGSGSRTGRRSSQQAGEAGSDLRYLRWRPVAVEVTLRLTDWGTITRLIEVAG